MIQAIQDREPVRILRWEYRLGWRYGPLLVIVVGLGLLATGLAGASSAAISTTSLPLGFASIVSGAVLPRIDDKFKATARGEVSGQLLAPHEPDYMVSGPRSPRSQPRTIPPSARRSPPYPARGWRTAAGGRASRRCLMPCGSTLTP
jgi:hypothetical protein